MVHSFFGGYFSPCGAKNNPQKCSGQIDTADVQPSGYPLGAGLRRANSILEADGRRICRRLKRRKNANTYRRWHASDLPGGGQGAGGLVDLEGDDGIGILIGD
jgi:hypothetical protein